MTLVLALVGTPALASAQGPIGPSGTGHPPMVQLATLPGPLRLRRRSRAGRVRRIMRWIGHRQPGSRPTLGTRRQSIQPRLPPDDSYARGPPLVHV